MVKALPSVLSRPMKVEFKVVKMVWNMIRTDASLTRKLISGLFRM